MRAINTNYKGFCFRSRLEARWAVFFDTIGIDWEYEKEGYVLPGNGKYLPDFWLPFSKAEAARSPHANPGRFVEIKPVMPTAQEIKKCELLHQSTKHRCLFFVGTPGKHEIYIVSDGKLVPFGSSLFETWAVLDRHDNAGHKNPAPVYAQAVINARSARFEHGRRARV